MKIVVIGGTGLIGSKLSAKLTAHGHDVRIAVPDTGVDTLTGEGLAEVLDGADTVVDVSNSPSFEDQAVLDFFSRSTSNILAAEVAAGVKHHVALSVVGTQRLTESGYFRGKIAQEELITASSVPYSIVHATQFFEFLKGIADAATDGDTVRLAPVLIQPIAADDVALTVGLTAVAQPSNSITEIAGPETFRLDQLVERRLAAANDHRHVVTDPDARYFGAALTERMLLPGLDPLLGDTTLSGWLVSQSHAA